MASPIPLEGLKPTSSFLAVAGLAAGRRAAFSVRVPHGGQHTSLLDTQHVAYIVDDRNINPMNYESICFFFLSETSLFAQDQTDNPLIAMVLAIAVPAPTSIHPHIHQSLHPSMHCNLVGPLTDGDQCLQERLPRVHRTYSGFADCRV